jgi:phosphatidylglycerol---prolipoprotein diacylglyceryl transferase
MRPILFQWRGIKVWSYPAMLYLGMVAGVAAGNLAAHAAGLDAFRVYVATLILFIPALLGAKLLYVLIHWPLYREDPTQIWKRRDGAAQYGGLIVALVFSVPLLTALRLPFAAYWDVAIFTILVLMIFGRVGCLMHGCCAGRPSQSWMGVHLPNHSGEWTKRFPTQLLEAGWAALLLIVAMAARHPTPFPGALFLLIVAGYSAGRLVMESTREETKVGQFTMYHGISALLITVSVGLLLARWSR